MFATIIGRSLEYRGVVLAIASALFLYGVWTASHARLDVLPDFAPPQVDIQTEAPGFAPDQVELLVTLPIETALGGVTGLAALRSESIQGLSVINAVFDDATDVYQARQALAERLADVGPRLPRGGAAAPSPLTSATMDVLKIGLTSHVLSPMDLRTLADWTLRPRLLMVNGVARVNVFGGDVRQLQIEVRPAAVRAHGLTLADVAATARTATTLRGAGFVETSNQRMALDATTGVRTALDLGATVVASAGGIPVRLSDVATIVEGPAPRFGDAIVQGEPGVLLTLSSAYGANTVEVTRALDAALAELRPQLERDGVTLHPALHRPASFVESAIANLRRSLLLGAGLVVVVLLVFLQDARAAFVSLTAIPLSLLTAVIVLTRCGVTLNTMSLGGLAIAIGEVVDEAIIDVDNIVRRLRANGEAAVPRPAAAIALAASLEVRRAVVFATLAVALVFLPLLGLGGLQGKFFAPLAVSYLLAILASLVVALTVTPALALTLLGDGRRGASTPRLQRRPPRLSAPTGLGLAPRSGGARDGRRHRPRCLLTGPAPRRRVPAGVPEHHLVVQVTTAPHVDRRDARAGATTFTGSVALPGIVTVEQQNGRAEQGEDTWGRTAASCTSSSPPAATTRRRPRGCASAAATPGCSPRS
jgi:Cu/Ag efflux pump CusA